MTTMPGALAALIVPLSANAVGCGLVAALLARTLPCWVAAGSRWRSPVLMVLTAAVLGALVVAGGITHAELIGFDLLAVGCAALLQVDLASHRLPDPLVGFTALGLAIALVAASALHGAWARLGVAAITGVVIMAVFFVLAWIRPADLGLGDVKLAGLLGLGSGWFGAGAATLGVLCAFTLGAVVAVVLLVTRRAGRRDEFPFGPCLIIGSVLGVALTPILLGG